MELKILKPKEHGLKLIPVPFEKLPPDKGKITILKVSEVEKYEVLTVIVCDMEADVFPYKLLLLATGIEIDYNDFKNAYPLSTLIYFYICKPLK